MRILHSGASTELLLVLLIKPVKHSGHLQRCFLRILAHLCSHWLPNCLSYRSLCVVLCNCLVSG